MCIRKWREYRKEKRNVKKLREAWLKRSGTMDYLWGKPNGKEGKNEPKDIYRRRSKTDETGI